MPNPEIEAAEIQAIWDQPPEEEDDSISENEEPPAVVSWDDPNWEPQEGEDNTPWSEKEAGPSSQPVIPKPIKREPSEWADAPIKSFSTHQETTAINAIYWTSKPGSLLKENL